MHDFFMCIDNYNNAFKNSFENALRTDFLSLLLRKRRNPISIEKCIRGKGCLNGGLNSSHSTREKVLIDRLILWALHSYVMFTIITHKKLSATDKFFSAAGEFVFFAFTIVQLLILPCILTLVVIQILE